MAESIYINNPNALAMGVYERDAIVKFKEGIGKLMSDRTSGIICLLTVIILSALWGFLTFDKLAVTSEGWYVVYSDMILSGKIPYRDFELVFPPLYTYLVTGIILIFGESLLAFRVIGIFVFVGLAVVSYYIFKLIFPPWVSVVAATITVFVLQSEITWISYDYIRFYDLFNYLAFFFILRPITKLYKKEEVNVKRDMFLAGIMCALAILVRQSSGAIVFVYFVVFLMIVFLSMKFIELKKKDLCSFFIGVSIPLAVLAVWLILTGTFTPFIEMTLLSGAKGSVGAMLFGWIPRLLERQPDITIRISLTMAIALILLVKLGVNDERPKNKRDPLLHYVFAAAAVILMLALFFSLDLSTTVSLHWYDLVTPMFFISLFLGLIAIAMILTKMRRKEEISCTEITYLFFCGFIFAVGFGSGTSSGLCLGQGALSFGFITAVLMSHVNKIPKAELRVGVKTLSMAFVIFLLATSVSVKVVTPYDWWGLRAEPYLNAEYETDIEYFNGIKLTADEKFLYEDFVEKANYHLGDGDEFYCYSQVAIFYTLAGKTPTVMAPVCWFDVVRDETVIKDLEYLKKNNPKLIMFADHGILTLEEHEKTFRNGEEAGQRRMYEWLLECRDDPGSDYTVIQVYNVHNYPLYLMLLN